MTRRLFIYSCAILVLASSAAFAAKPKEIIDPKEVANDPDFKFQGEYLGEATDGTGSSGFVGAQVIARGDGKFDAKILIGGLPGEGWSRYDDVIPMQGKRDGDKVVFKNDMGTATIADGKMTLEGNAGQKGELKKVTRKSPTLGKKAPEGAVVVFDGKSVDKLDHGHLTEWGTVLSGVTTKDKFDGKYDIHLEFKLSWMPTATGQARSNSGVYLHDCYEVQVLDSFGLEGKDNECGGIYSVSEPSVNMCFPPMTWQTYDIEFTAPEYKDGKKVKNARATIKHNGVVIHDNIELHGTPGRQPEGPGPRPLHLQGHGNKVQYRNVWVKQRD